MLPASMKSSRPDWRPMAASTCPKHCLASIPPTSIRTDRWPTPPSPCSPRFSPATPLADALPAICHEALNFEVPLASAAAARWRHDAGALPRPERGFQGCRRALPGGLLSPPARAGAPPLTILVATSGDTGAAVAAAFHRQPGVRVVILYPDGRVSPRQAHQLGCFGDNVQALRVAGSFDDCQRMVKSALNDETLQAQVPLSSANSISLGRLLPQMSYYAHSALGWWRRHRTPLSFIVPTGNLGNALACVWVREMGLPIGEIHLACNANMTLGDYFDGDPYTPRPAIPTLANAMDVGAPSNFERLRWTFPHDAELRAELHASSVDDDRIAETIIRHAENHQELFCPHTATAMHVLDGLPEDDSAWAVVATAHPAKFETVLEPLLGFAPEVPPALAAMLERRATAEPLLAEDEVLKGWLRGRVAA